MTNAKLAKRIRRELKNKYEGVENRDLMGVGVSNYEVVQHTYKQQVVLHKESLRLLYKKVKNQMARRGK